MAILPKITLRKSLWHLVGPAVVIVVIVLAGPTKVWGVFSEAKLNYIAAAISLSVPLIIAKAVRWRILLRCYEIELGFAESTYMYSVGTVLSAVTPGRMGDMIKIVMLNKRGVGLGKAIACNVIDRLLDILTVLLTGYLAMLYFSVQFASQLRIVNISSIIILTLTAVILAKSDLFKKSAIKLVPAKYRDAAKDTWYEITSVFKHGSIAMAIQILLLTILFWGIQFYAIYFCAMAVGAEVRFTYMYACAAAAMFLSLLPISVAGVGTRDVTYILLLSQVGISSQQSIAISTLVLSLFLINCIIFYLVSVIFRPKQVNI